MKFVQHNAGKLTKEISGIRIGQQKRKLLWRRHQNVRRLTALTLAAVLRRVARACLDGNGQSHLRHRPFEIALDVHRQRLEGRDV